MARIDHIAYRVADRNKTAQFFIDAFGYKKQTEFELKFDDGSTTKCIALEPPEKPPKGNWSQVPWTTQAFVGLPPHDLKTGTEYHLAPECFISDGPPDSIVGKWVAARGGIGGIHHLAYQADDIQKEILRFKSAGVKFLSEEPLVCPDDNLTQIFSAPIEILGGIIIELIQRGEKGFCQKSVANLMTSTKHLK